MEERRQRTITLIAALANMPTDAFEPESGIHEWVPHRVPGRGLRKAFAFMSIRIWTAEALRMIDKASWFCGITWDFDRSAAPRILICIYFVDPIC